MDKKQLLDLAGKIASRIGFELGQTYEQYENEWWLCTGGVPMRVLRQDEIEWHIERRHKPFVPDGIDKDDSKWWDGPPTNKEHSRSLNP